MAFANVAGVALGFILHAFISALGLSLLIAQSSAAFMVLKWIGVVYLLWLGWSNLKAGLQLKSLREPPKQPVTSLASNFVKGLLTNLLNPKIVLFYLSIFPQFVSPNAVLTDSLLLGLTQAIVVSVWFFVVILGAQKFKTFLTNAKSARWLNFLSGSIFVAFSAKLATAKL
jgi:threonine/homoserine/homoserine lactone efflux protein